METSETSVPAESVGGEDRLVTAHRSAPDRVVFTEEGNAEGWISSGVTVDLLP